MRLITGGSGYLGIALTHFLLDKGFEVRGFDLKKSPLLPENIDFFQGDIRDERAVMKACAGISHVYHLAALLPQRKAPPKIMRAVHMGGTENVLRAAAEHNVQRVVFLSSSEVYGKMKIVPCPEDAPRNPLGEYARNKIECEAICERYAKEKGLKISILRPPTLIGPGILDDAILLMMKELRRGGIFPVIGSGRNRVQALDVMDCAQAVFVCGEKPEAIGEVFNIGCSEVPTLMEIAVEMKKYAGTRVKIIRVPAAIGINLLRLLNLFGVSPMMPEHYELLTSSYMMDTTKIKKKLGWAPEKTYLQSARNMYDWYLNKL